MCKIIGIGNALVDNLVFLNDGTLLSNHALEKGGMKIINTKEQELLDHDLEPLQPKMATGGSAANTVMALSRLGAYTAFIGKVGNDSRGEFFRENQQNDGIESRIMIVEGEPTGIANTLITPDGERTFGTLLGAAAQMTADDINVELLCGYDLLHIEGYLIQNHEMIEKVCQVACSLGMRISLDLGSWNIVRDDNPFFHHLVNEYVNVVFANQEESEAFTGKSNPEEALRDIAEMVDVAVVKLGSKGASAMKHGGERVVVESKYIDNVVDTTGAGDYFAAGFLYALQKGWETDRCLAMGAHLSETVIQVLGTHLSEKTWNEIKAL